MMGWTRVLNVSQRVSFDPRSSNSDRFELLLVPVNV